MNNATRITTDIEAVVDVLLAGGIVGLPTETVYGLAACADNEQAVRRVFATKGRPSNHPLIVHLGPNVDPDNWGNFNVNARLLAQRFWPGPLTLLVPRTARVGDWVTGGRDTVAIRVPSHPKAQEVLNKVNTGVVAPSANRFGKVSPTTAEHVLEDLGEDVDLVLDGGPSDIGVESTIVECVGDDVVILRPGGISEDDIRAVVPVSTFSDVGESRASGMLASHYAPSAEVRLFSTVEDAKNEVREISASGHTATLLHYEDVTQYAEHLYADLRVADDKRVDVVCAVLPTVEGVGAAIRDRLKKASHR